MSDAPRLTNWKGGVDNNAPASSLPPGTVRHAVNVDASPKGPLTMRAGHQRIYEGTMVRGVLSLGSKLLIADGINLVELDTTTGAHAVVREICASGPFVGDVMAGVLYFSTQTEALCYDGYTVKPWGVPDVYYQPAVTEDTGTMLPGEYQVALTYTDQWGREGGTDRPVVINARTGGISVDVQGVPAGCTANVYVGSQSGETLYLQAQVTNDANVWVSSMRDDTRRCDTILLRAPRPASRIANHNAVMLNAVDKCVEMTRPMQPHLVSRTRGLFQYAAPVGDVMSDGVTAYVSADKCYALLRVETDSVEQPTVLEFPAIAGTSVKLPDGRVAWMTQYGQAISKDGSLDLVNRGTFSPATAKSGAAGVVDNNGNQLIVTSTHGTPHANTLAAADYYIGEILNP